MATNKPRRSLGRGKKAALWAVISVLQAFIWTALDWPIMLFLRSLGQEMLIGSIGLAAILGNSVAIGAVLAIVFLRPDSRRWMLFATTIVGFTSSWIFWGIWMAGLWINTSQQLLELLQKTPLFR